MTTYEILQAQRHFLPTYLFFQFQLYRLLSQLLCFLAFFWPMLDKLHTLCKTQIKWLVYFIILFQVCSSIFASVIFNMNAGIHVHVAKLIKWLGSSLPEIFADAFPHILWMVSKKQLFLMLQLLIIRELGFQ